VESIFWKYQVVQGFAEDVKKVPAINNINIINTKENLINVKLKRWYELNRRVHEIGITDYSNPSLPRKRCM